MCNAAVALLEAKSGKAIVGIDPAGHEALLADRELDYRLKKAFDTALRVLEGRSWWSSGQWIG